VNLLPDSAERLTRQTAFLADKFVERITKLKGHAELVSVTRGYDAKRKPGTFENGEYFAVGIDGSMDYDERLEMLLFYISATAYRCPIEVRGDIRVDLKHIVRDAKLSASAAVPMWLEDIPEVSQTVTPAETDFQFELSIERIPFALMTLGELSIALDALEDEDVKVLFLDRPLSGTFGPASRDTRLLLHSGSSALTSFKTKSGEMSMLDIRLGLMLGPGNLYVPRRSEYLVYAAVKELLKRGEMRKEELARELGLNDEDMRKLIVKLNKLDKKHDEQLLEKSDLEAIKLRDSVKGYWDRIVSVISEVRKRVFESEEYPLQLSNDKWLTVLDLNAVNTFIIYELAQKSLQKNTIVLGITKDTNASDFTRSIIPYAVKRGVLKSGSTYPSLRSDRSFLTIIAAVNSELIKTPWRTIGYDTCFTTMNENKDSEIPLKAARKRISRERLFVKCYFQLRTFNTDSMTRSPIFVYDRFYNAQYDELLTSEVDAFEQDKKVKIKPYFEGNDQNELDDTILHILAQSDNPEVFEALGHNQLLYLADKAVKADVRLMRGMLRGIADLHLSSLARKERIFSISRRFRDLRSESEKVRERAKQEVLE
jgi:hypothetical protein